MLVVAVNLVKVFLKVISLLIKKHQQAAVIMQIKFLQIYQHKWWAFSCQNDGQNSDTVTGGDF